MKKRCFLLLFVSIILFSITGLAEGRRMKHLAGFVNFLAAIQEDATVKATGSNEYGQCDTSSWRNVVEVAAGFYHTLGLKADGTVYATGDNSKGQCNVQDWKNIVMIAAGADQSIGLKRDGTVVYAGNMPYLDKNQINNWRDIVWVAADWNLCGIDKNGGIVGTFPFDVVGFHDVIQVYEGADTVNVLNRNGTVQLICEYNNDYNNIIYWNSDGWSDICEITEIGPYMTALKRDGTVVSESAIPFFKEWKDVVEIGNGFGVKMDGSIIYAEYFVDSFTPEQLNEIRAWKVKVNPDTLPVKAAP